MEEFPLKRIFFVPPGPNMLQGKLFLAGSAWSGSFRKFFESRGIELKTIDQWNGKTPESHEALVVWNHPDDYWWVRFFYWLRNKLIGRQKFPVSHSTLKKALRSFPRKILFQWEPPIVMPYPYKRLGKLKKRYDKVFTTVRLGSDEIGYFLGPYDFEEFAERMFQEYFNIPKTKFLTLINSNARVHGFRKHELYTERLRAIRYFSKRFDFDLYGERWDKLPRFPNWLYRSYVKKSWRGRIPGPKYPVLAQYKFTILFENSTFPGYVDVKFLDCFVCGVVPVYLGAPDVLDYVPPECFIDMRKFSFQGDLTAGGQKYDYEELEKYLRAFSASELEKYRLAMEDYIHSKKFREMFSFERLAKKILESLK